MINYHDFLNQRIISKNGEVGIVTSFDEDRIVVMYQAGAKAYRSEVAFKTGFLSFQSETLKREIDLDLLAKERAAKKKEEEIAENHRKYLARRKEANEIYKATWQKNRVLLSLFGADFVYPPLKEIEKRYGNLLDKKPKAGRARRIEDLF